MTAVASFVIAGCYTQFESAQEEQPPEPHARLPQYTIHLWLLQICHWRLSYSQHPLIGGLSRYKGLAAYYCGTLGASHLERAPA